MFAASKEIIRCQRLIVRLRVVPSCTEALGYYEYKLEKRRNKS